MSFDVQPARNRQSGQADQILPEASTPDDGLNQARMPAVTWRWIDVIVCGARYVAPPSTERTIWTAVSLLLVPTNTTWPLGWIIAWGLYPSAAFTVPCAALQVSPPSVDVLPMSWRFVLCCA